MPETIDAILQQGLDRFVYEVIQRSRGAGQEASGKTYRSISVKVDSSHGEVWAPNYLYTLADGRGPGKVPYNFGDILLDWAKYKGISFPSPVAARRWANAVAWKIRKQGSMLFRQRKHIDLFDTPLSDLDAWIGDQLIGLYETEIEAMFNPNRKK